MMKPPSRDLYQRKMLLCNSCRRPILPELAITHGEQTYCSDCMKNRVLQTSLNDLEPRDGETMDAWLVRWKKYREHCINSELSHSPGIRKKAVFRP